MQFWGRPSSFDTVSWGYEGRNYLVTRPEDGSPARHWPVRCPVCSTPLNYTVHSVAATRRRRSHRWIGMVVSFAIGLGGFSIPFIISGGDVRFIIMFIIVGLGIGAGFLFLQFAAHDAGFAGHGASWPSATKHKVILAEPDSPPGSPSAFGTGLDVPLS
jgi:hypothetical protein